MSSVRKAPFTYQLSPQPSPFASVKLYACQVLVDRTTAILLVPSTAGRTAKGAYPTRPSGAETRTKYSPLGQEPTRIRTGAGPLRCPRQPSVTAGAIGLAPVLASAAPRPIL